MGKVFRGYDRGIVVGSVYATAMLIALVLVMPSSVKRELAVELTVVAMFGLVAGAIGGFSNTIAGEDGRRDLKRNISDGGMIVLWSANALLAANLITRVAPAPAMLRWLAALAGGVAVGALVGEPLLARLVRVRVRGRQPLLWVNEITARIAHPDVRFVVRVAVQTIVVGALLALAFVAAIIVLVLVALAVIALVIAMLTGEGGGGRVSRARHRDDDEQDPPLLQLPPGSRILPDGRIVKEGLIFDDPTGLRINEHGQVVEEGLLFDKATGVKIDGDGRIVQEGMIFDKATGARIVDGELVEEGLLFDQRTGLGFDGDGRVVERGIVFDEAAGVTITAGGKVRRNDSDPES